MSKLTVVDIADLTTFFASPMGAIFGSPIAAQSYEPRGKTGYDPSTDTKLAALVLNGTRNGKNPWSQMKRVLDLLSEAQVDVLRLLCRGRSSVACRFPRALDAGRKLAEERARLAHLEHVHGLCLRYHLERGVTLAMRVLEADRRFVPPAFSHSELLGCAREAVDHELVDVDDQLESLLELVGTAYHAASSQVAAWQRTARDREDDRRASFRAELADKQATRERIRFERALRSAS